MIRTRSRTRGGVVHTYAEFYLTSSLPSNLTFTRNDSVATYRDSSGYLKKVSAINTPLFDHTVNGVPLGMRLEPTRTNKLTHYNASPTDTTGLTKGGDALATLTIVDLPSAFDALKLGQVGNGKCFKLDNSAGSTTATVDFTAFGNTNPHTISCYAWGTNGSGNSGYLTRGGTSAPTTCPILVDAARRYTLTLIPALSTDKMRITAKAGYITYFILSQMEEAADASSPIVVSGAAATRGAARCYMTGLNTKPYFDPANGFIGARFIPETLPAAAAYAYPVVASDNTTNNAYGPRIIGGDYDMVFYAKASATSISTASNDVPITAGTEQVALCAWSATELTLMHGDNIKTIAPIAFPPVGITYLDIGSRNGGNDQIRGWISEVVIGKGYKTETALGSKLYDGTDIKIAFGGQSLAHGYFGSFTAAGRNRLLSTLSALQPYVAVTTADGAVGGTVVSELVPAVTDYWWNLGTDTAGPMLTNFYAEVSAAGITPSAVFFEIGETDSNYIGINLTKAQYKTALEKILLDIRSHFGDIPVIFQTTGRKESFTNTGGVQAVRESQLELDATYSWFHTIQLHDATLVDGLHPDQTGYENSGTRLARKLDNILGGTSTGVNGPTVSGASRVSATVTVTLSHDGGTDFTPTSGIGGFKFFDDTSEIAITAAVRTNATTITLTLASAPSSGIETLYYGYDNFPSITSANVATLVKDNATVSMPLRTAKVTL